MKKNLQNRLPKEELVKLYKIQGQSLGDIAKSYRVSRVAIMKYCNILGIERRTKGEARILAQKRGKIDKQRYCAINEAFFSSWSPDMAYILGLMMTDGCISRTKNGSYRISLCLNDRDLLLEVARTMGSAHTITDSKYQKGINVFIFGREKIAHDLIELGMKPRKSLNLEFPEVPKEYLRDFIRGVFDGDGSVYYPKKSKAKTLSTKFVSGSRNFIYGIEKTLRDLGMPEKKIYEDHNRKNIFYMLRYGHNESSSLYNIMYKKLRGDLYLKRKYDKFKESLNSRPLSINYKQLRKSFSSGIDFSVKDMATFLNINTRSIYHWTRGGARPTKYHRKKIQEYFQSIKNKITP